MQATVSDLIKTVETIRKRIHQIRDRHEAIGEQNTKATLVEPLLMALGWDLQEIDEVRREHRRKPHRKITRSITRCFLIGTNAC